MARKVAKYELRLQDMRRELLSPGVPVPALAALAPTAPPPLDEAQWQLMRGGSRRILSPDSAERPDVSVIIPVYNQSPYTLACLRSLLVHDTTRRFEVIVVDDCSTDDTALQMRRIPWVHYLPQQVNGGFIASCNAGLARARGEYVLFLNNDTEVLPGWLDELSETFVNFPSAGLVGSVLIYPNGVLQESGGIVWRDGQPWNYGRNATPRDPQVSYARPVAYCSGASIMLPRALIEGFGGFDRHFAPAYYEDTDLAMKVREAGLTVMVQPLSKLIHYEGITSGTDTTRGVKAYQVVNAEKFFARWQTTLQSHPDRTVLLSDAKDFDLGPRLLVIAGAGAADPAGEARSLMLDAQALGWQVTFLPEARLSQGLADAEDLQRRGIEVLYAPYCPSVEQHLQGYGPRYTAVALPGSKEAQPHLASYAPQARLIRRAADLRGS
ncbi:glycosyltransferase family 2 protein [Falsigemmobacter faecalis]|uniref:Glycosyltransferase family 2 protein n=1 Tax=Falsigemmobacter faecalis TaxID=2488730 RepID=A0A3P3DKD5_9RHOB|nr:glycosyltransferase family 2 protein [Falsigemmobacter faecalis]RRH74729.1 glycosyltransferase family 2 protein [Falsigemmobacter faecalis]